MINTCDVIVVGLGAMGSATACELARRGYRVVGLDKFTPPHDRGSSAGETRIIREAYFEHPLYVPFIHRAYERWSELEALSGEQLFLQTGALMIGPPRGVLVSGALASAREHGLEYELLDVSTVRTRFPVFRPTSDMVGVWEPRAGMLYPERCVATCLRHARGYGATLRYEEPLTSWKSEGGTITVHTARETYTAPKLVLCTGAWMLPLIGRGQVELDVERVTLHWLEPRTNASLFEPQRLPVYVMEYEENRMWYGFPMQSRGIKVARHHQGRPTDPDDVAPVTAAEQKEMCDLLARCMPDANGRVLESATCMYTNTADQNFVIDTHPANDNVLLISACSGHGFKFATAIGEMAADLVTEGTTRLDLTPFRLDRFSRERSDLSGSARWWD